MAVTDDKSDDGPSTRKVVSARQRPPAEAGRRARPRTMVPDGARLRDGARDAGCGADERVGPRVAARGVVGGAAIPRAEGLVGAGGTGRVVGDLQPADPFEHRRAPPDLPERLLAHVAGRPGDGDAGEDVAARRDGGVAARAVAGERRLVDGTAPVGDEVAERALVERRQLGLRDPHGQAPLAAVVAGRDGEIEQVGKPPRVAQRPHRPHLMHVGAHDDQLEAHRHPLGAQPLGAVERAPPRAANLRDGVVHLGRRAIDADADAQQVAIARQARRHAGTQQRPVAQHLDRQVELARAVEHREEVRRAQDLTAGQRQEQRPRRAQLAHHPKDLVQGQLGGQRGGRRRRVSRAAGRAGGVAVEVVAVQAPDVALERQLERDVERDHPLVGHALQLAHHRVLASRGQDRVVLTARRGVPARRSAPRCGVHASGRPARRPGGPCRAARPAAPRRPRAPPPASRRTPRRASPSARRAWRTTPGAPRRGPPCRSAGGPRGCAGRRRWSPLPASETEALDRACRSSPGHLQHGDRDQRAEAAGQIADPPRQGQGLAVARRRA